MSGDNPKRERTPEELYLEELYRAMDTGEVPEGMVPPQIPSLLDSKYQFREIKLPSKQRKTPLRRMLTAGGVWSATYVSSGILVFFSVLNKERLSVGTMLSVSSFSSYAKEMFVLLFWVFFIGAVISAATSALTIILRLKVNAVRKYWPFAVFIVCFVFAVITGRVI